MTKYDIAVIGGGPGGYTAAIRAAREGARVCLVERDKVGGTCLHHGCIPTKAFHGTARLLLGLHGAANHGIRIGDWSFDFSRAVRRKDDLVRQMTGALQQLLKENGVDVFRGTAKLAGPGRIAISQPGVLGHLRARNIILATGSISARPPALAVDGKNILTSREILGMQELPESLLIVGGGYIGCEFASIFSAFGCRVVLVEQQARLLGGSDDEIVRELTRSLRAQGVEVHTGVSIEAIDASGDSVHARLEDGNKIQTEKALVAVGRIPAHESLDLEKHGVRVDGGAVAVDEGMRTSVSGIYAIGDMTGGPQLAHAAFHQADVAVINALGGEARVDFRILPSAVFTLPEMAQVGLTESGCKAGNPDYKVGRFSYRANGKALCEGETRGFVKLVADGRDGTILGASIFGAEASVLIAEVAAAMRGGLTAAEVARIIHTHPTLAEMVMESAGDADNLAVHKAPSGRK
jgi:dihydrolipoamide dehydrogenase